MIEFGEAMVKRNHCKNDVDQTGDFRVDVGQEVEWKSLEDGTEVHVAHTPGDRGRPSS